MKKILFVIVLGFLVLLPQTANAHVLVTDGSMGAVMHISPDDDPVAGQVSNFYFDIKDKQDRFTPSNCDCQFTVSQNDTQLYAQPLFQNYKQGDPNSTLASYAFPATGVYRIAVNGKPTTGSDFQAFSISYDVRVARTSDGTGNVSANDTGNMWLIGIFVVLAVTFMFVFAWVGLKSKSKHPRQKRKDTT